MQTFNYPSAKTPDEIRAEIERKRGELAAKLDEIKECNEHAADAIHYCDVAFANYWRKRARKLQPYADALESTIAELTAQLAAVDPGERTTN